LQAIGKTGIFKLMQREASFSDLITATIAQISIHRTAALVYLAISVPLSALASYVGLEGAGIETVVANGVNVASYAAVFVQVVTTIAVFGAQFGLYEAMLQGRIGVGFGRLLPFFGVYFLGSVGIVFGFVLFIIPGLIILTRWVLILPIVVVGEVPAMDSFGESWRRTKGSAWPLFFVFVLLVLSASIVAGIAGSLSQALSGQTTIAAAIAEAVITEMGSVAVVAFGVGAYRLLTDNTRELEEVFA
jgi:Membrane domain of glycerophosphoryl diester phosphodiesterase